MKNHRLHLLTTAALLGVALACQSGTSGAAEGGGEADATRAPDDGAPAVVAAPPAAAPQRPADAPPPHVEATPAPPPAPPAEVEFARAAFPPLLPLTEDHQDPWGRGDCLLCHETGVGGAPLVKHQGMSHLLLQARCRTCHLLPDPDVPAQGEGAVFAPDAFPPTLPLDDPHRNAWLRTDCMSCHEYGVGDAPVVRHEGMSHLLLKARCRSCHLPSVDAGEVDLAR